MPFKKLPDNLGLIYVPDCKPEKMKNSCPDCFSCQWCGNERCRLCKGVPPKEVKRTGITAGKKANQDLPLVDK